jgi:biopolymer transport protein ExbB/TolQ
MNSNLRGLIASAAVAALAPLLGLGVTLLSLSLSFQHTASVDPPEKARVLAAGISNSMYPSAVGIAVSGLALVAMITFAVRLYRASKRGD